MVTLTDTEIEALAANIGQFSPEEQAQIAVIIDELEKRKRAKVCQDSLIEFCKHMDPTYVVAPHHKRLAELLVSIAYGLKDRIAVSIPPRHGKLCADSTPVLTPSGWKTHGELVVGDLVYGPDGVPTRILAISEPGVASVEFEFSNGDVIKVHENHEWTLFYKPAKQWMTLESREFSEPMRDPRGQGRIRAVWTGKRGERGSKTLWKLPKISPIQCQTKELPLDPYVFGVWLGDGTAGKTTITMGAEDFEYVLPAFQEAGWAQSATFVHKDTGVPTISFGSGRMGVKSAFKVALEATGACYAKQIPEVYKRSNVAQRLALLAGLIDTDGHVESGSNRVRIVTVSRVLAEDIAEIATTLGFAPYITTQEPVLSSSGIQGREVVYTVGFQPRCAVPTRIPRKKITGEVRQDRDPSLVEVRKATNPEIGRCIQVDRDDGLYLVGRNLTPTHNSHLVSTLFPAWFLGKFPDKKVLMVSHTGDLAVDFGRKVRNIIADPRYTSIFPGITLAQDSKSAGRWSTNHGGEYFACLRLHTPVHTSKGPVTAARIKVGDTLLNAGHPVKVLQIYNSTHDATYCVAGMECSAEHPVWTMNRGWVPAADIFPSDLLRVESISDRLKALLRRAYGYLEHPRVSALVQHQVSLREPQQREVPSLRRAWNLALRAVAEVREFLVGYGFATISYAYSGAYRQRRTVLAGELQVGNTCTTGKQQANKRTYWGQDVSGARSGYQFDVGSYSLSLSEQYGPIEPREKAKEELQAYDPPEKLGWLAVTTARLITTCGRNVEPRKCRTSNERYLARFSQTAQKLCGLLLGVRPAGEVTQINTPSERFVNFLTDGDHTFFASGVLTHNCGVGAALAGRGADLLLVDDPHSEQDLLSGNFDELDKTYQWFAFGARTRLMSGGRVAVVHTRWHGSDLIGHLIKDGANNPKADQYEVFEFPAILDTPTGQKALWPEKFDLEALERTKASMPTFQWNAQYMQNPTGEQGALIQRDWWKPWTKDDPPSCEYIIMALDAASEKTNRSDYTALLTFGVFSDDNLTDGASHIILLNAINVRVEFPELKDLAIREWKDWEPDAFIVEKKSSGIPLYQELRRMGIPVQEFTPHRGTGDKIARLSAVADILRSGMVWYPAGRRWAEEVIEQSVAFPYGSHDDLVDCLSMCLARYRQGGFISLPSDYRDREYLPQRRPAYY